LKDSAIVKVVAIGGLTLLEIVNLCTARVDGALLFSIGAIIGGIAGYEIRKQAGGEGGES